MYLRDDTRSDKALKEFLWDNPIKYIYTSFTCFFLSSLVVFVLTVQHVGEVASLKIRALMNFKKKLVEFKHDNGSTVKVMPNHIYTKWSDDFGGNNLRKSNVILFFLNKSETKLLENFAEVSEILEIGRNT